MEKVRETYDRELDAKHAAARGLVDAIVTPENVRDALISGSANLSEYDQPAHRRVCSARRVVNTMTTAAIEGENTKSTSLFRALRA